MNFRLLSCVAALSACAFSVTAPVQAQTFPPAKPISLIVGFVPGGAADAAARMIATKLSENIGKTVIVQNKPGAGGNIAHQMVANSDADGSVLLFGSVGPLTIAPHMMKLNYDPFKDLAPVSGGVYFPNILVAHKSAGVKTLAEYVELSRKNPGSVGFASTGSGSASHMAGELLSQYANIDMIHVPYKGGGQALQDLIGERVTSYFAAPPTAMPHIEAGNLIPLASTGLERPSYLPADIPTVSESGYPGFEALNWYAFVAPGATPEPILDRWNEEIVKVLNDPEIKNALNEHGLGPQPTTRAELTEFMKKESQQWEKIIRERNLIGK